VQGVVLAEVLLDALAQPEKPQDHEDDYDDADDVDNVIHELPLGVGLQDRRTCTRRFPIHSCLLGLNQST
jgi:hypothetical protein